MSSKGSTCVIPDDFSGRIVERYRQSVVPLSALGWFQDVVVGKRLVTVAFVASLGGLGQRSPTPRCIVPWRLVAEDLLGN